MTSYLPIRVARRFLMILPIVIAGSLRPAPGFAELPTITGAWRLSWVRSNGMPQQAVVIFHQDGETLSGSITVEGHTISLAGNLSDDALSFTASSLFKRIAFHGRVSKDTMQGSTDEGVAWSAVRQ